MGFCAPAFDRDSCLNCDLTYDDAKNGALCPKIARCQRCQAAAVIPIEIYGQEPRFWCGNCGLDVEVPPGAVVKISRKAVPKAKVPLEATPLEMWMVTEANTAQAVDLIKLRQELLEDDE